MEDRLSGSQPHLYRGRCQDDGVHSRGPGRTGDVPCATIILQDWTQVYQGPRRTTCTERNQEARGRVQGCGVLCGRHRGHLHLRRVHLSGLL